EGMHDEFTNYSNAKDFGDVYIGPALFTKGASVQLFLQLLEPNLMNPNANAMAEALYGEDGYGATGFSDRIGRKVLPTFLSVYDDPTRSKYGEFPLAGMYKYDDEVVEAKPITLIENRVLRTLLSTRTPSKKIKQSNGRARGGTTDISNFIVESKGGKSFAELKQQLMDECKAQGVPFGIILRDNNSTYGSFGATMVYRVDVKTGNEELMRGASISDFSVRELRDILAAGNDPYPFNLLVNSSYNGTGTPASVVAPSVLVEEIYLTKAPVRKERSRLLTHPFFNKDN
ncbi:MAG: metallopeptidase TldD-related protein, partial [Pyrinomonadaceae bacterium]